MITSNALRAQQRRLYESTKPKTPKTPEEWLTLARTQQARFWSKVDKAGPAHPTQPDLGPCWLWLLCKDKDGYGKWAIAAPRGDRPSQKHVRAHRMAYEIVNGLFSPRLLALHSCDNPTCVNPAHLRPGSQLENRAECSNRGRAATGDRNGRRVRPECSAPGNRRPRSKMTADGVRRTRELREQGLSNRAIAKTLQVSEYVVCQVLTGKTWRHVPLSEERVAA